MDIPLKSISRLTALYQTLLNLQNRGQDRVSSSELEEITGISAATIRKDLQYLGSPGQNGAGYDSDTVARAICTRFGLDKETRACIVGLGNLGQAILQYEQFNHSGYSIIAGFDANTNKVETMPSPVRLYPTYEMEDVIRRYEIEMGIIAVPASAARDVARTLIDAGIRSLINFAPVIINVKKANVIIRNIDIMQEFRIVSAIRNLQK